MQDIRDKSMHATADLLTPTYNSILFFLPYIVTCKQLTLYE